MVGQLAQARGVENVSRLVSSAKSWLSHAGVDRTSLLLPPNAPDGVKKLSPIEASRAYCTIGEMVKALEMVYGRYREVPVF